MPRHRFFTLSPAVLCSIGFDGFFKRVNPAFTSTLGYSEKEIRRTPVLEFVHPEDRRAMEAELEALRTGADTRNFENRCRCRDGSVKWLAWTARSYSKDKVIYAAAKDTTEQKEAEEKLKRTNQELEKLSAVAQAATRAKSEFLANISHELRTPMTAILAIADMLLDSDAPEGAEETGEVAAVRTIRRNGEYLLTLINEILDLSKIEAGKLRMESIACSPSRLVADVVTLMRVRAHHKNLQLSLRFLDPMPASVRTDPTRVRQILINLIENAIKFTERGGIEVRVRYRSSGDGAAGNESEDRGQEENGEQVAGQLEVAVTDSGIGMTEEQRRGLFRPFTQADPSTTRRFGGTGLGLSISKRLATMLGGDILVESEAGRGSTFTVTVAAPTVSESGLPSEPPIAEPPAEIDADERAGRPLACRVLLVEDYPDIQLPVTYTLRKAGILVRLAENGQEAIDRALEAEAEGEPFDVVLMDMQMPIVDGYTATERLRRNGYIGAIIAMTAHAMECDRRKCLGVGCDDYIAKPLDMGQLLRLIRSHQRRNSSQAARPLANIGTSASDA